MQAIVQVARYHGIELDPNEFRLDDAPPTASALSQWAQNAGLWSRAVRIRWRQLLKLQETGPVILLLTEWRRRTADPRRPDENGGLSQGPARARGCGGSCSRRATAFGGLGRRGGVAACVPDRRRLGRAVQSALAHQSRPAGTASLRDIGLASFTISFLTDLSRRCW